MQRDHLHNYKAPCIYHITICKAPEAPRFSNVLGPSSAVAVERTEAGRIVERHLHALSEFHPDLRLLQYVIMPDHLHFILHVRNWLPKAIGSYIGKFKVLSANELREYLQDAERPIYERNFHDRILRPSHSLNVIFEYVRNNPLRLVQRRENRDYFRMTSNATILNRQWTLYGNLQLLQNPFKHRVYVSHSSTPAEIKRIHYECEYVRANGGVLVSPFISPHEREVIRENPSASRVIYLTNEAIDLRTTPKGKLFDACVSGNLLIVAPHQPLPEGRQTWLFLNRVAQEITEGRTLLPDAL